jgi:hypothetical protein
VEIAEFSKFYKAPVADVPDSVQSADVREQPVLRVELSGEVGRLLDTLPEMQREVLVLHVVVGLSAEETAQAVGSTPGAVRVAQHRALARLRKLRIDGDPVALSAIELLAEPKAELLLRSHQAYVDALSATLDLDVGLAHLQDRYNHRNFVAGLAGQLNLDAGLEALLRSTKTSDMSAPPDPDGTTEGGDPACWLDQLCPECRAVPSPESPQRCWRCGSPLEEEGPASRPE